MTIEQILKDARAVDGYYVVDKSGDLLVVISRKESLTGVECVSEQVTGFDIIGTSKALPGFHKVFETSSGQYIAMLGASYFLIDSDKRLLSEGGHVIHQKGDTILTGYGGDLHINSGVLNERRQDLAGQVFFWDAKQGCYYADRRKQ